MICKTRLKPFDVLIKNRMANMTSVDRATQLVDECPVKRTKKVTHNWLRSHQQKKTAILKKSLLKQSFKLIQFFLDDLNPQQALFCELSSSSYVTVIIIILRTIQLLKQTWFILAKRGSQIKSSSAN